MRKLLILTFTSFSIALMAQSNWKATSFGIVYDNCYQCMELSAEYGNYPDRLYAYRPDLLVKESRKTRKKKRKARKKKYQLPVTNMQVLTDREKLAITVAIDTDNKEIFHLKLINAQGKVVKSYLHLSPKSIKEFKMHTQRPGNYKLNLYAGIERRLLNSYTVKWY